LHSKFFFFIGISSILTIALYNTTANFVSATSYECFGRELDQYLCVHTSDDGSIALFECVVTHNPLTVNCDAINKVNLTPGLKADIDASLKEEVQSNTKDSKDIGGLKDDSTDQGNDLSPESAPNSDNHTDSSSEKVSKLDFPTMKIDRNSSLQK